MGLITGGAQVVRPSEVSPQNLPWTMLDVVQQIKLSRTALIQMRLGRTVGLVRELELTVIIMAVGEVGVVGVPAVRRVARGERYGPGSVKTLHQITRPGGVLTRNNAPAEQ